MLVMLYMCYVRKVDSGERAHASLPQPVTTYVQMSLAHEWHARVARWPALRGAMLQNVHGGTLNKRLRKEVLDVVSKKRWVVAAAVPSAGAVSLRGHARASAIGTCACST